LAINYVRFGFKPLNLVGNCYHQHSLGIPVLISGETAGSLRQAILQDDIMSNNSFSHNSNGFFNARIRETVSNCFTGVIPSNFCKIVTSLKNQSLAYPIMIIPIILHSTVSTHYQCVMDRQTDRQTPHDRIHGTMRYISERSLHR